MILIKNPYAPGSLGPGSQAGRTIIPGTPLEYGLQTGLFTQLVGRDPVQCRVPFDRDGLLLVRIDRMVFALAEQAEAVLFEISNQFTSLDGHLQLDGDLFQQGAA